MSGYWKIWHDMRGRFIVAAIVLVWQIFATSGPLSVRNSGLTLQLGAEHPKICVADVPAVRAAWTEMNLLDRQDLSIQQKFCAANEMGNPKYAAQAMSWNRIYIDTVWNRLMPVLILFLGILLAVGPPFGGEIAEASVLTFSLPWSRGTWLRKKIEMTGGLLTGLIAFVLVSGRVMYHLPAIGQLHATRFLEMPGITDTIPSLVAAGVGISLGILSTIFTRNALAGAILASLTAYILALVDWSQFTATAYLHEDYILMDMTSASGVFVAFTVVVGAITLTYYRLSEKDL